MKKPMKIGCSAQGAGRLFLINSEDKRYEVSQITGLMWRVCNGQRSIEDIASSISSNFQDFRMNRVRLRKTILRALKDLKSRNLIAYG